MLVTSPRLVAKLGKSALMRIDVLTNSLSQGPKRMVTKVQRHIEEYTTIGLRNSRNGAAEVFIDFAEELKHTEGNPIFRFTKTVIHHTNIQTQNPSLGIVLRRRQSGKSKVPVKQRGGWPKKIYLEIKRESETAFLSPSESCSLSAPSTVKPEEREFAVDSGASMHMIIKNVLNFDEIDTLTKSFSPTIVMTANGESANA